MKEDVVLNKAKWIVGFLLVAGLVWGTHAIVRMNEVALGATGRQPAGFFGH